MSSSNGDVKTRMPNPLRRLAAMGMIGAFAAVALLSGCSKEDPDTYDPANPSQGSNITELSDDEMIDIFNNFSKALLNDDEAARNAEAAKYYCSINADEYLKRTPGQSSYSVAQGFGNGNYWNGEGVQKREINAKRYSSSNDRVNLINYDVEYRFEDGDWKLCKYTPLK
nr:hypothetical protein [Rhodococcus qingshengii]